MNIFAIEGNEETGVIDWYESGRSQDNLRTVKMVLETTQLLSSAMHLNGMQGCYKLTHANHPSTLWTKESSANWQNLFVHGMALLQEYEERFGRVHKCRDLMLGMEKNVDFSKFPTSEPTPLKMAMPDEFRVEGNPVKSYRDYFSSKEKIRYPADRVPMWFLERRKIPFDIV